MRRQRPRRRPVAIFYALEVVARVEVAACQVYPPVETVMQRADIPPWRTPRLRQQAGPVHLVSGTFTQGSKLDTPLLLVEPEGIANEFGVRRAAFLLRLIRLIRQRLTLKCPAQRHIVDDNFRHITLPVPRVRIADRRGRITIGRRCRRRGIGELAH